MNVQFTRKFLNCIQATSAFEILAKTRNYT